MPTRNTPIGSWPAAQDPADEWVTRVLRKQPPLTAPATLERRVLAALAATPTSPWWQQPLLRWPRAARFGFLAVLIACAGAGIELANIAAGLVAGMELSDPMSVAMPGYSAARALFDTLYILTEVTRTLVGSVPEPWLHGGLLLVGLLYGLFFGLGAVGYRALRAAR